jgi:hypothetical protein
MITLAFLCGLMIASAIGVGLASVIRRSHETQAALARKRAHALVHDGRDSLNSVALHVYLIHSATSRGAGIEWAVDACEQDLDVLAQVITALGDMPLGAAGQRSQSTRLPDLGAAFLSCFPQRTKNDECECKHTRLEEGSPCPTVPS